MVRNTIYLLACYRISFGNPRGQNGERRALAEKTGISAMAISKYENNQSTRV